MKTKRQSLAVLLATGAVLLGFALLCWFSPAETYSESERRALEDFPQLNAETLLSGKFMEKFESYAQDQFPLRDGFRRLKALTALHLFRQQDNNGIYEAEGSVSRLEYPLRENMVAHAAERIRFICETYLAGTGSSTCLAVAPDKNYYLAAENGYPALDYAALTEALRGGVPGAAYIDLFPLLSAGDYYRTDTHWRQEKLLPVAEALAAGMGTTLSGPYEEETLDVPFRGVYVGQSALPLEPDTIRYLTSAVLENAKVQRYGENGWEESAVYDFGKAAGKDAYEFFLSGAEALITLENPLAETDRELILFRDSFGSSLAPLLLSGYAKITLVDIRYVSAAALGELIDFHGQDVLFLYSSLILNASSGLR